MFSDFLFLFFKFIFIDSIFIQVFNHLSKFLDSLHSCKMLIFSLLVL
jgi:hypothetical protein